VIKVLIVDDSLMFQAALKNALEKDVNFQVVGVSGDPTQALQLAKNLKPDVITLDVEMPKMNGLEFLEKLLPSHPIPTVVVTSSPLSAFRAIHAGAVDLVKKPGRGEMPAFEQELRTKLKIASTAKVKPKANTGIYTTPSGGGNSAAHEKKPTYFNPATPLPYTFSREKAQNKVVAIGASTGGTEAILEVVRRFPKTTPGVVIVQHMPAGFTQMYAERMNKHCAMEVREARDGDRVKQGLILLAAGDHHLRLLKDSNGYYVTSRKGEKYSGHCPSVDVLFLSVAETAGSDAVGALLTGMGADGAEGLLKMKRAGAFTVGQNKETCVVYGMPAVAHAKGATCAQAGITDIAKMLLDNIK